jgi:cell division protein FtsQ
MNASVALKRRLVVALVLTLVGGVAFSVYTLRVDEIRVTGARTIDPKLIVQASGLKGGERILWIRLSSIARRIERLPAVASATAERSFPETVVLRVRERTPLARLGPPGLAVDGDGRVFASPEAGRLPVVEGWTGKASPGSTLDATTVRVVDAFEEFPEALRRRTARITIGPPLSLWLTDGTEIRFGTHDRLHDKAQVAVAVLAAEGANKLEYVDVRAPRAPVTLLRPPPTPAPTPRPSAHATAAAPASPETPSTPSSTAAPSASPAP